MFKKKNSFSNEIINWKKKMSYIQWFHLCSLGTKWTYLQIFVKYSLKLSFIFFKQNYVFLNQVNLASHENWPKRIKLMPHYQIKYVSNYLFPSSLFQKMDTYNESRINTPNVTFQTPTFSISVALSISTILIGSIVTFINVSVLVAAMKCSPKKQNPILTWSLVLRSLTFVVDLIC